MSQYDNENSDAPSIAPGTQINQYRILEKIGSGGMGEVYLARDQKLNREVAVKFLSKPISGIDETRSQFVREAQAAAAINHPHIVTVYEVGEFGGRPFFVMEYLRGRPLSRILDTGPVPVDQAIEIILQICRGLGQVHDAGLVHRDIKPSNILLDEKGQSKLLDFGLAIRSTTAEKPAADSASGTIYYMSPEQINDEEITPAADLFSIGVILYQIVTGHLPFEGEYDAQVAYSIVNEQPRPISSLNPSVPPELIKVINRLLEKNVDRRYRNAGELHDDLIALKAQQNNLPAGRPTSKLGKTLLYIGIVVIAAALALVLYNQYLGPAGKEKMTRKMVAVLPFENLGPPEEDYFADGITDEIIAKLSMVKDLGVISRTSVMHYKNTDLSAPEIAAQLGADYILEGSIKWDRSGNADRVRITPQLVRAADDSHLWAQTYDRALTNIFAIQTEIAEDVSRALHIKIGKAEAEFLQSQPTENLQAYDFYLRGNDYFNRSWSCDDIAIAIDMYKRAVEIDPDFALAYAMLSRGHESYYWERCDVSESRRRAARDAAIRALEIQPDLPEVQLALGYIYYHCDMDYEKALEKFGDVLNQRPSHGTALTAVATVQRRIGPLEKAVENFKRSLELDPRSHLKAFDVGLTYGLMRDYASAEVYLDRALALAPDWDLPYIYKAWLRIFDEGSVEKARAILDATPTKANLPSSQYYWWLARIVENDYGKVLGKTRPGSDTVAYWLHVAQLSRLLNRNEEEYKFSDSAREALARRWPQMQGDARFSSQFGLAYAGLRQKDSAIYCATRAVEMLPASRDAFDALFLIVNLAEILVIFEEYDAAVEQLEYLLSIPGFVSIPYLKADPLWKPLHNHPRFRQLVNHNT